MSAKTPPVGIDHPTVVPTNFDGDDAIETDSDASSDAAASRSGTRNES